MAFASCDVGVSVAVGVPPPGVTAAGTILPDASRSWNVVPFTDEPLIISLNVAETTVVVLTPLAPVAGVTLATVGGVVSTALDVKTTSTQ